jgi:hypothetical protein
MKLTFSYNLEKDIRNFLIAKKSLGHSGRPSKMQALFEEKYGQNTETEKLREFITDFLKENKINFEEKIMTFQKSWNEVNDEVFSRMEKIFKIQLPTEEISVFLTINDRKGYNPGLGGQWYFFVNVSSPFYKITCVHEIFHFYTHLLFESYLKEEKGFSPQEFYNLKESLTEIINHEFADLMGGKEFGNIEHKDIRQKIGELWEKEKDIKKVVGEIIKS